MNSLVLKPWRCVVFFGVIPGIAPCSGLLRPSALATGAARRAVPREACEVRRTGPAAGFFARGLAPGEALFVFWRGGLHRTSPSWSSDASSLPQLMRALGTPLHGFIWGSIPKNNAPDGEP